jgi:hypothetical protein
MGTMDGHRTAHRRHRETTAISGLPPRCARRHVGVGLLLTAAAASLVACGSSSTSSPAPSSPGTPVTGKAGATSDSAPTTSGGTPQVEVNPPGDIPDNQAFVPYHGSGYTVSVPEGWARTAQAGAVVFSDKYNSITITTANAASAPTPATARSRELPAIKAAAKGFSPGAISTVHRAAGSAVLITYHALSAVNPVTGKVANEAVERYEFWRNGHEVVLTLAAPVGSDNVDPWRKVTDSFTWK